MNTKTIIKTQNISQFLLLLLFLVLFFYILSPFIFVLLLSLSIVITTYSLYNKLLKIVEFKAIAAILMLLYLTILVIFPLYFISITLYSQSIDLYQSSNLIVEQDISEHCSTNFCEIIMEHLQTIITSVSNVTSTFINGLNQNLYLLFSSVSTFVLHLFVLYVSLFYFYIDKNQFINKFKKLVPLSSYSREFLILKFTKATKAVFVNSLLMALIQGLLVGFGFYIFGLPGSMVWAIVAAFLSLIPFIGASVIWFPACIYLLATGNFFAGIGLFIYSIVTVSGSDSLLRPILLEKSIHVHPFLILLSIIGGIQIFGFAGIFYGPLIISVLVALFELYNFEFESNSQELSKKDIS
ncbi:MAG: AI-2E family transporter [Candidatus Nanoarchaeia archaeon]